MKVLVIDRQDTGNWQNASPALVNLIPDSAVKYGNKPLFLPDFTDKWVGEAILAFRISRLGKNIQRKFAHRYYDAVTVAVEARPEDGAQDCLGTSALTRSFDGKLSMGDWVELPLGTAPLTISLNGESKEINLQETAIEEYIEHVSHFCTLKMGDILVPMRTGVTIPLALDTEITTSINGNHCVTYRVK
jgi:2-keto-4-pentenoate hydratase/2-oxohepta-3-ene-1,7-dioic acid hydratase in catechol pathway